MIDLKNDFSNDFFSEILGKVYHLEKIFTIWYKSLWNNNSEIFFKFPKYEKVKNPLNHVSANQINEAVMEWIILVVANATKNNEISWIDFNNFLEVWSFALYREFKIKYKKEIFNNSSNNSLIFTLDKETNCKNKYIKLNISFKWFCEWSSSVVIDSNWLVNLILKK